MNTNLDEIARKRRSDSALAQLTPEQHERLRSWLSSHSYETVLKLVAEPPPLGFGIQTHRNTLHRYQYEQVPRHLLEQRMTTYQEFKQFALAVKMDPIPYRTVALELLEQQLMMMTMDPQQNMSDIISVSKILLKHEEQLLKEKQFSWKNPKPIAESSEVTSEPVLPEPAPPQAIQLSQTPLAPASTGAPTR